MKKALAAAVTATAAAVGLAVSVPGSASAAGCSTTWGSQPEVARNLDHGTLTAVRTGRHACFDRLVLDVSRPGLGYSVKYVSNVRNQGEGAVVPLRGRAFLEVVEQSMVPRRIPMPAVTGYTTFRQVGFGGSFEGYTTIGLGVRGRLPFRTFLSGNHLVVDVAHRW